MRRIPFWIVTLAAASVLLVPDHAATQVELHCLASGSLGGQFGTAVRNAGDVDGDGVNDLIVGAPLESSNGKDSGSAYVYSGSTGGQLYSFRGPARLGRFGLAVGGAGDVDNDGLDDLIVGAPYTANPGGTTGLVQVLSGADGAVLHTFLGNSVVTADFGVSVDGAGDVNGDGFDDVIIGQRITGGGRAHVMSGKDGSLVCTLTGIRAGRFGRSVAGIGDVDGDGVGDLIVGAPEIGSPGPGYAQVFSGATCTSLCVLNGSGAASDFGYDVRGAGDVDGDGVEDVVVGAPDDFVNPTSGGCAEVFSVANGNVTSLHAFTGAAVGDKLGWSVAGAGDWNNDGRCDVVVGAIQSQFPTSATGPGYVEVYSGLDGSLLQRIPGSAAGDDFGYSVDGSDGVLRIGSPHTQGPGRFAGSVWVYSGTTLLFGYNTNGARLYGFSVSSAGDVDADGVEDFIVGAPDANHSGPASGSAYVHSGATCGLLHVLHGPLPNSRFGMSVGCAGDVDNDGHDDVIVGAPFAFNSGADRGTVRIFSGDTGAILHDLHGVDNISGNFGMSVSGVGDLDGDNHDDFLIGARLTGGGGTAWVRSGKDATIIHTFVGNGGGDRFGRSVADAGDVDGDGFHDIIVGAPQVGVSTGAGYAVIYSGRTGGLLTTLFGTSAGDDFGYSVSGAGDLDGDGFDEVIVGAPSDFVSPTSPGHARIYSHKLQATLVTLTGGAIGDKFGWSVSAAGDVNGDGTPDVVVGALQRAFPAPAVGPGYARVFSGSSGTVLNTYTGEQNGFEFGHSVSEVDDLDGDGTTEIVVGIPRATHLAARSHGQGRARVFLGCRGSVVEYGSGCAGTGGIVPRLEHVSGCPDPGHTVFLRISDGPVGSSAFLFVGLQRAALPIGGGCTVHLVPLPSALGPLLLNPLGSQGGRVLSFDVPPQLSSALTIDMQAFILDTGAVLGFSSTNGLEITMRP